MITGKVNDWLNAYLPIERKPVGLKDRKGVEIHTGDVVEFYFCADKGHYTRGPKKRYTRMRDVVVELDGAFYFMCGAGGAHAVRHARYCLIIGTHTALVDT